MVIEMGKKHTKFNYVGSQHKLRNGTVAEVIAYAGSDAITVKVLDTGSILLCNSAALSCGVLKDPLYKSVCGVGYYGYGNHKATLFSDGLGAVDNPVHALWVNMLNRCYGKLIKKHYKGVTVCERWHNFQNFANDVQALPGFDKWVRGERYELDKDIRNTGMKRTYSPSTCSFVKQIDNLKARKF